jgi:hypothetical protein
MREGLRLEVWNLHVADDYTVAELQAIAATSEGFRSTIDIAGCAVSTATSLSRSAHTSIGDRRLYHRPR